MDVIRAPFQVDVSASGLAGVHRVVGDAFGPRRRDRGERAVVLVCLPGGGMTRGYYDLEVSGEANGYSMARHLASRGLIVATVDPPGVGDSDVPDDGYELTPDRLADVLGAVTTELVERARRGTLLRGLDPVPGVAAIGLGHSAGALLTVHQQARLAQYEALVLLGFAGQGLVDYLTPEERGFTDDAAGLRANLARLVEARFGTALPDSQTSTSGLLVRVPVPDAVRAALTATRTRMLGPVGLTAMIPGASSAELSAVDVPVFLGVGDRDITGAPHRIPADLPNATDLTLFVLETSGHNHNVAPTRAVLWDRIARWAHSIASP